MPLLDIYPSSTIYNFDETRFNWDVCSKYTYDFKGAQRVVGIQSAKAKHSITVMLLIRADGKKFPALLIFQEKTGKIPFRLYEHLTIPNNIVVKANRTGYITDDMISDYLRTVLTKERQLIIMDQATSHKTDRIVQALSDLQAQSIIIPGGCTKHVQPLDVIVIANFKRKTTQFRVEYETEEVERRSQRSGNIKALDRQQMINLASKAWEEVHPDIIITGFQLTGSYGVDHPKFLRHRSMLKRVNYLKNS
ncbi:unnamed protein product [Blepharisma stoltei]|uniref:DDE-1 domain-containing protein n=1 Tax=Blepharisma stoltei TaxID=1481888 RepID=A0AAU9JUG9_9CILI|nr:unnamed protein product [Blepharisma stoltei]